MKINKIEVLDILEQNLNKNSDSNDNIIDTLKSIYSQNKDINYFEKISELKTKIEELKSDNKKQEELFISSEDIRKRYNKKIEEIDYGIHTKRVKLMEKLGEEI